MTDEEWKKAMAEYLANDGKIEQIAIGRSSPQAGTAGWGRPKKAAVPVVAKVVKPRKPKTPVSK